MKRFMFGFLIGIMLPITYPVKAQEPITPGSFMLCPSDPRCPADQRETFGAHEHDLTVKEIVEILSETDVRHGVQQPFFPKAYGATNFTVAPPAMWIFDGQTIAEKHSTTIHELVHIHCHNVGVDCPEEYVDAEEARQYQKLFGVQ